MSQTTYNIKPAAGLPGLPVTRPEGVRSYIAAAAIAFGTGLAQGATDDACKVPASSGDKLIGLAMHTQAIEQDANGVVQYAAKQPVNVLRKGVAWVKVEQTVAAGDPVFVRHTANGAGKDPGNFRKDIDTDKATQMTGAIYVSSATAGNLAQVELNLPA